MKTENWQARLTQIAAEHPDAPGKAGAVLRQHLSRQARNDSIRSLQLAHARSREAVVTGARMALRCGALLLDGQGGELAGLLRVAGIRPQAAAQYSALALEYPDLARISVRHNGRITETQALRVLRGAQSDSLADPVADLRVLRAFEGPL